MARPDRILAREARPVLFGAPVAVRVVAIARICEPGFLTEREGRVFSAVAYDLDGDRIRAFYAVLNPDKLGSIPTKRRG